MKTINKTKRQLTEWEKIFANEVTNRGLISKIYKHLIKLLYQKKKTKIKKVRRSKQTLLQSRQRDGQKAMSRWSISLVIREMQIKTTMRYYLPPVRMAIIKSLQTVLLWYRGLRIWCCHCSDLGRCCGMGLILDLGTSTRCRSCQKRPTNNKCWKRCGEKGM